MFGGCDLTEDERKKFVGARLGFARAALGKDGPDWAREYGVGETTQSNWIQGVSFPNREFLIQLCDNEGLTIDYFYRGRIGGVSEDLAQKLREAESGLLPKRKRKRRRPTKSDPGSEQS